MKKQLIFIIDLSFKLVHETGKMFTSELSGVYFAAQNAAVWKTKQNIYTIYMYRKPVREFSLKNTLLHRERTRAKNKVNCQSFRRAFHWRMLTCIDLAFSRRVYLEKTNTYVLSKFTRRTVFHKILVPEDNT